MSERATDGGQRSASDVCAALLAFAEREDYRGYDKHDALNSPFLKALVGNHRWLRLLAIQSVMRCPVNLRPLLGVRRYRNPKGIALFARAYLHHWQVDAQPAHLERARALLAWLEQRAVEGYSGPCWGYFWDWQDLGFFAPFGSPNCVVTTFVGQALVDGYEAVGETRYLRTARASLEFIRRDLKVLYQDERMKCVSYVPSQNVEMAVMDVSALAGALMARVYRHTGEGELATEARKLVNYVADKQTEYGAWFYTHPPGDSPVKHDNYHTGFILDALLDYQLATGDDRFRAAYRHGLDFYRRHLFRPDGAPKWMSDRVYPLDVHGAATGVGTLARAAIYEDRSCLEQARRVARWAIANLWDPRGFFYHQKGRWWTRRYTLMRWCNAWMAFGLSRLKLTEHELTSGQRTPSEQSGRVGGQEQGGASPLQLACLD